MTATRNGGATAAELRPGDGFDVLEVAGDRAWGIATATGLVGYTDVDALEAEA